MNYEFNPKRKSLISSAKNWDKAAQNANRVNYSELRYRAFWFRKKAREMEE